MKLTYFEFPGRAGPIRIALGIGKIAFEDERFAYADWPNLKGEMPLGAVPVLDVQGTRLCQSNAILRYAGRLSGLYPDDLLEAAKCDQMLDTIEEILSRIVDTMMMEGEEQKAARDGLCEGPLPFFLDAMQTMVGTDDKPYVAGGKLSVADLKLANFVGMLSSGQLDYVPTDFVERNAPGLAAHAAHIGSLPQVAAQTA
ncbi:MAG: glutathione S-transferase [Novosphingobium sp.]|nr:glutathione S-transferase [Novosphingobium sp.]